jgi:hypothetical protein
VAKCFRVLMKGDSVAGHLGSDLPVAAECTESTAPDFTKARHIRRPQAQDIISTCFGAASDLPCIHIHNHEC